MNLPSNNLHLEIAPLDNGYVVQWHHDFGVGSVAKHGVLYLKSREELQAWLANTEIVVK